MHITRAGRQTSMPQSSTHLLISEFLCSPLEKERPLFLFFLPPQNNHTKITKLHALEIDNMPCKNLARGISCIRLWLMWQKPQNHLQRQKKLTHLPSHFPSLKELWLKDNLVHILHYIAHHINRSTHQQKDLFNNPETIINSKVCQ